MMVVGDPVAKDALDYKPLFIFSEKDLRSFIRKWKISRSFGKYPNLERWKKFRDKPEDSIDNEEADLDLTIWALMKGMVKANIGMLPSKTVALFCENSAFASDLVKAFNAAGYDLTPKHTPIPPPTLASSLPDRAPRLWADRPIDERGMNAAAWIRLVYAPWLGRGLARHHVGEFDPDLGKAYSMRIRKGRHPEDTITEFAEGNPYGRLEDAEALRRRRASSIESKVRARAAKMPQP